MGGYVYGWDTSLPTARVRRIWIAGGWEEVHEEQRGAVRDQVARIVKDLLGGVDSQTVRPMSQANDHEVLAGHRPYQLFAAAFRFRVLDPDHPDRPAIPHGLCSLDLTRFSHTRQLWDYQ